MDSHLSSNHLVPERSLSSDDGDAQEPFTRPAGLPLCATEAQLTKYPDMKRLEQCEAQRASG
jgi:hypothetical protein